MLRRLTLLLIVFISATAYAADRRPNILIILVDDMGWRDLSVTGSTFYETPNIDRIAHDGMRFTQAYAACPVCSPSRASLLTGHYPATLNLPDYIPGGAKGRLLPAPFTQHLSLDLANYAKLLHDQANYTTWHIGKWHLGRREYWPEHQGFDVNIAGCNWGSPSHGYFSPWKIPNYPDRAADKGKFLTDALTDEAVDLIKHNQSSGKPFLLNYWPYAVHVPIQAPKDLIEKYKAKSHRLGLDAQQAFVKGGPFPIENKSHQRITRRAIQSDPVYAALIENLDTNIGRILGALDETNQSSNTLIIFSSDNGGLATAEGSPTSNLPLLDGKGWLYEGGIREPFLVKWPGHVVPGSTCDVPITSPDLFPTLLSITQTPAPDNAHFEGVSFLPLLQGAKSLDRDAIYWHYPHYGNQGGTPCSAIRAGDWKLIEFFEDGRLELYNLKDDPGESHNVVKENSGEAEHLHHLLIDWRKKVGAVVPMANPDHREIILPD
jgi:arylsulfatase A-like enzyme